MSGAEISYPGVYVDEEAGGVRSIPGVPTSIGLFIGWCARGPTDRAVSLSCFAEYERHFGPADPRAWLGHALRHFFENGGSHAVVIRVAGEDAKSASGRVGGLTVKAGSPGAWGNALWVERTDTGATFRIEVRDGGADGAVLETFDALTLDEGDFRFAPAIVNGESSLLTEAAVDAAPSAPAAGMMLAGGADGAPLRADDDDFVAALPPLFEPGGAADQVDLFNLLCVPGLTRADAIEALLAHADAKRAFMILDCAEGARIGDFDAGAPLGGPYRRNAALYFPWVRAEDPAQSNALRAFPPSGMIAGVYARTDATRGVWKAPAGKEAALTGATGLTAAMTDAQIGRLNPKGVNALRSRPGAGPVVWGGRTLAGDDSQGSEWKYVPVRRLALFIEESLYRGTPWVVFEPNDEPLWAKVRLNVGTFMQGLFRQGALKGLTPSEAYFVKCDRETVTQHDVDLGRVNIVIGFAPLKPAEFVVITIRQMARQTES